MDSTNTIIDCSLDYIINLTVCCYFQLVRRARLAALVVHSAGALPVPPATSSMAGVVTGCACADSVGLAAKRVSQTFLFLLYINLISKLYSSNTSGGSRLLIERRANAANNIL